MRSDRANKSDTQKLSDLLGQRLSESKIHLYRNLYLGGAAASLAIIMQLVSLPRLDSSLQLSLLLCSISLPAFIGLAAIHEFYVLLGRKSYHHRRTPRAQFLIFVLFALSGASLQIAVAALIHHMSVAAAFLYLAAALLATLVAIAFQHDLASWYLQRDGATYDQDAT